MIWHILPVNDTKPHEEDINCACEPQIIIQNETEIVVHNSYDGREGVEIVKEILRAQ